MIILVNFETFLNTYFFIKINGTKDWLLLYKQMDACNEKVDVLKIPFWPFLGGEQDEYFFHFFINCTKMELRE